MYVYALALASLSSVMNRDDKKDANAVYLSAARWILLGVDPLCTTEEVFAEGIKDQGPQTSMYVTICAIQMVVPLS